MGYVSRRQAAALLGFASDFKVRQLEKEGRLHPRRGAMGQAWYPRDEVLAAQRSRDEAESLQSLNVTATGPAMGRWSDGALIRYLRTYVPPTPGDLPARRPTVVDLVADTGISIARAEKVYRFWLAHDDAHRRLASRPGATPTSRLPEQNGNLSAGGGAKPAGRARSESGSSLGGAEVADTPRPEPAAFPEERRGPARRERDDLISRLRDPHPAVRAAAFARLKKPAPA